MLEVMDVAGLKRTVLENNLCEIDELALEEDADDTAETIRVCGDGASGSNSHFELLSNQTLNVEKASGNGANNAKKSKIPVRQNKASIRSGRTTQPGREQLHSCYNNNLVCGDKEFEQSDSIIAGEHRGSGAKRCEVSTAAEKENLLSPSAPLAVVKEDEEEAVGGEDEVDFSFSNSLPAPEPFRQTLDEKNNTETHQVEVDVCGGAEERHVELSYRDHDNACVAETGDTTRRAINFDDGGVKEIEHDHHHHQSKTAPDDVDHQEKVPRNAVQNEANDQHGYNHQQDHDNVIGTDRHVGFAVTAPKADSDTQQMHVEEDHLAAQSESPDTNGAVVVPLGAPLEDVITHASESISAGDGKASPEAATIDGDDQPPVNEPPEEEEEEQTRTSTEPDCSAVTVVGDDECAVAVVAGCDAIMSGFVAVADAAGPSSSSGTSAGSAVAVCLCADQLEFQPAATAGGPSIRPLGGVAECARTSSGWCSRVPTAKVSSVASVAPVEPEPSCCSSEHPNTSCDSPNSSRLRWRFKNGRLTFEEHHSDSDDSAEPLLSSKDLNKRNNHQSRLKYLEQKLKEAGITDDDEPHRVLQVAVSGVEQVADKSAAPPAALSTSLPEEVVNCYDSNQNVLKNVAASNNDEIIPSSDDGDLCFCEFDVRQVGTFTGGYCEVYDELDLETAMREDGSTMGVADTVERAKHNPNRDNLKSLLKRPGGRAKQDGTKSNRVVFNENKNEFFDADYIILIREDCDYDEEDDDGVCTCNQHEMVRLTCCEPNCNCSVYEGCDPIPQSPKFAPPIEFVDAVTLSPPEGYKDMELGEHQQFLMQEMGNHTVCKECSISHEEDEEEGDSSQSDNETCCETSSKYEKQLAEREKTDQSQQTTPTTPPNDSDNVNNQHYILETITMTTITEQRILREADEERRAPAAGGSPINGILKGGRLWKQQSFDVNAAKPQEPQQVAETAANPTSNGDEEGSNRRSVRFIESSHQDVRDCCDGAPDNSTEEYSKKDEIAGECKTASVSPESAATEMMLTFKLGNHVLISNNSLKPNSAVRQLFPCTKPLNGKAGDDESIHRYLVTAESLRAFEEAKRSKLPQIIQSGDTDESIKRAIERNTLRRSLIRYEPRNKKNVQKTDNSLVERIKQLTCDVDDVSAQEECEEPRLSPTGEEARINQLETQPKTFSPSSSSSNSSSSSMSSTYKKITDLFGKRQPDLQNGVAEPSNNKPLPDLGNGGSHLHQLGGEINHCALAKANSSQAQDSRKQFMSTLAPLTACVSGMGNPDEFYYHISNNIGERGSMASTAGTEYSLEDIDEGLKTNGDEDSKRIAPDVLAGTPNASDSGDELAIFVQQDASRIERIKKKYQPEQQSSKEDDEHDDYGFNRRPSVRGIKPRFGSTTEILQQIQNQLQPPVPTAAKVAWPYYSESGLTGVDNSKMRNMNQNVPNYQYPPPPEEMKTAARTIPPQYRPTSLEDENIYQNCSNQRCVREVYRANVNQTYSSVVKVSGGCTEYYQSYPRARPSGRPLSPPPLELSKNYHQMIYIPYNSIEGYQNAPPEPYYQSSDYMRVSNQNQINKRYIEPTYQRVHHVEEHHYGPPPKPMVRMPFPQPHMMARSESPLPGQFSTARATQTPAATSNYYPGNSRYRPVMCPVWQGEGNYVTKNRQAYPPPRYPAPDNISLTDSDSQHSAQITNGFRQSVELTFTSQPNPAQQGSPTKTKNFIERGVPEGAVSAPPSDSSSNSQNTSSTMTSPTSPQNSSASSQKPMFYAMNV